MDLRKLHPGLSVSGQIKPADLSAIKEAGFRTIICNRPDQEEPGQPTYAEIEKTAKSLGLETVYQPITPGVISMQDVEDFASNCARQPAPVLAYCRTGARSETLWSMVKQ
ncbi:TIGR01244 family sulfur transferase [Loktanella sp. S4079]|uniref:TIGR01244 family sulfur transferase n=1 Tax=Loktanella sp. S4079 TaxID=579483 RepID=UPI0005F9D8CC|nr:TIGR01244 family sulfur transferase [Loktanella sp. S4079]KJZ19472.1 hypothetical protein TW80_09590 [Loktanella sp. S4079]